MLYLYQLTHFPLYLAPGALYLVLGPPPPTPTFLPALGFLPPRANFSGFFRSFLASFFWSILASIFDGFLVPTWLPKPLKIHQKSMQKSISFLIRLKTWFFIDFDRFLEPKWSQVGTKIGSKIDINFDKRFFKNILENQWNFNIFEVSRGRSWDQKSIKNRYEIGVKNGMPLGIDFSSILVDFRG